MTARMYRFSLARVLALRERSEKDASTALGRARAAEAAIRDRLDATAARLAEARAAVLPAPGETRGVAHLLNAAFLAEQLSAHTTIAGDSLATAQKESEARSAQLAERVRDRRILERLRDRQHAEWNVLEARREREEMDGIAQTRDRLARMHSPASTQ